MRYSYITVSYNKLATSFFFGVGGGGGGAEVHCLSVHHTPNLLPGTIPLKSCKPIFGVWYDRFLNRRESILCIFVSELYVCGGDARSCMLYIGLC